MVESIRREPTAAECWADYWTFCRFVKTEWEEGPDKTVIKPYPVDWEFLRRYNKEYTTYLTSVIVKARGMLATTDPLVWALWNMLCAAANKSIFKAGILRQSEPDAKILVDRTLAIYDRLPKFLQLPLSKRSSLEMRVDGGGFLRALHAGGEAGRGEGWDLIIVDEFAYQEQADKNFRAFIARSRRKLFISTPNGKGNKYYKIAHGELPGVHRIDLDYREHPDRKPGTEVGDAWIALKRSESTEFDWQREQERSFEHYAEEGWFIADFAEGCVKEVKWDSHSPLLIGIDPGFVDAGAMISYVNDDGQWCRIKEFISHEETTEVFCTEVFTWVKDNCPGASVRISCDRAALQRKSMTNQFNENTDIDVINRVAAAIFGVDLYAQYDKQAGLQRKDGHRMIRQQFRLRDDGKYGTLIDPEGCTIFIDGLRGGYRQMENATSKQLELEEPNRASDHVHIFDSDRYAVVQFTGHISLPDYDALKSKKAGSDKPHPNKTTRRILDRYKGNKSKVPTLRVG